MALRKAEHVLVPPPLGSAGGKANGVAAVGYSVAGPQKTETSHRHITQQLHSPVHSRRDVGRVTKRHLQTHVHSGIIHNSKRWTRTKGLSANRWLDKQNVPPRTRHPYYPALKRKDILISVPPRRNWRT